MTELDADPEGVPWPSAFVEITSVSTTSMFERAGRQDVHWYLADWIGYDYFGDDDDERNRLYRIDDLETFTAQLEQFIAAADDDDLEVEVQCYHVGSAKPATYRGERT